MILKTYYKSVLLRFNFLSAGQPSQCAIPVFEDLLPQPHNKIIITLLFELSMWHALAKLRLHTESTLRSLETTTKRLGGVVRQFKKVTCTAYIAKSLPADEAPRGRRTAALHSKQGTQSTTAKSQKEKDFNLSTYKFHALGDYANAIRMFGPTDGYTTEIVRRTT